MNNEITVVVDLAYADKTKTLYVATSKDIRVYDMHLGKCLRIYSGMISSEEEIAKFALSSSQDRFIVADTAGNLHWITISDGLLHTSKSLTGRITSLYTDSANRLLFGTQKNVYSLRLTNVANLGSER